MTTQPDQGAQEESSEDEMVFEAYVSPLEVAADQDDAHFDGEVLKVQFSINSPWIMFTHYRKVLS